MIRPFFILFGFFLLRYCESKTEKSQELYAGGLRAKRAAMKLPAAEQSAALEHAIALLRAAQEANEGTFFPQAHGAEAGIRELRASIQKTAKDASCVRHETIDRFRRDAAEAAPAFYNLASAFEAAGSYREALSAYQSYLQWIDESQKILLADIPCRNVVYPNAVTHPGLFQLRGDAVYVLGPEHIRRAEAVTGEIVWEVPVPPSNLVSMAMGSSRVAVYDGERTIRILDASSGALQKTITLSEVSIGEYAIDMTHLFLSADESISLLTRSAGMNSG